MDLERVDRSDMPSLAASATPSGPYSLRPPTPPPIHQDGDVPIGDDECLLTLLPSYGSAGYWQLSNEDVTAITGGCPQTASDSMMDWAYEMRRVAQPVLDFLYLGPISVVKDRTFMRQEGITMVVFARDARIAARNMLNVDKAAHSLGIIASHIDVDGPQQLIHGFDKTICSINNHLLRMHNEQAQATEQEGQRVDLATVPRHGKVLVACETGNDRSAAVVAAYIMALYGETMFFAMRFVSFQRFCSCFGEDSKRILQAWGDILIARAGVALDATSKQLTPPDETSTGSRKRSLDGMDTSTDDEEQLLALSPPPDYERFAGRETFAPFRQRS